MRNELWSIKKKELIKPRLEEMQNMKKMVERERERERETYNCSKKYGIGNVTDLFPFIIVLSIFLYLAYPWRN